VAARLWSRVLACGSRHGPGLACLQEPRTQQVEGGVIFSLPLALLEEARSWAEIAFEPLLVLVPGGGVEAEALRFTTCFLM
jgi:hypothetical protein